MTRSLTHLGFIMIAILLASWDSFADPNPEDERYKPWILGDEAEAAKKRGEFKALLWEGREVSNTKEVRSWIR